MLGVLGRRSSSLGTDVTSKLGNQEQQQQAQDTTWTARRKSSLGRSAQQLQSKFSSMKFAKGKVSQTDRERDQSTTLGDLFLSLPAEIQLHVVLHLCPSDLLSWRLVCSATNQLFLANQSEIVRVCVRNKLPAYCHELYPCEEAYDLRYLYGLLRRLNASSHLSTQLSQFIFAEFILRNRQLRTCRSSADPVRLKERMTPLIFTLCHFFESWRNTLLEEHGNDPGLLSQVEMRGISEKIMGEYEVGKLVNLDCMHHLLLGTFSRLLRPPTYATGFERSLRGWTGKKPSTRDLQTTLLFGGIPKVRQIISSKSFSGRCKSVDAFIKSISPEESIHWKKNWNDLLQGPFATHNDADPEIRINESIPYTDYASIWDPVAAEIMIRNRVIQDESEIKSTRTFVSETLGYDIVRGFRLRMSSAETNNTDISNDDNDEEEEDMNEEEYNSEDNHWNV